MGHPGPALDHELEDASGPELVEGVAEIALDLVAGVDRGAVGRASQHDPERIGVVGTTLLGREAHGEGGVVGANGAGPDEDRVAVGPQPMGVEAGGLAGDPLGACRRARRCGRRPMPPASARRTDGRCGGGGGRAPAARSPPPRRPRRLTSMPAPRRRSRPAPATLGSGSVERHHHPGDPGLDDGVGAGRGAPVVGARLEGDVEGAAPGRVTGGGEGDDLGVGTGTAVGGSGEAGVVGLDRPARRRRRPTAEGRPVAGRWRRPPGPGPCGPRRRGWSR